MIVSLAPIYAATVFTTFDRFSSTTTGTHLIFHDQSPYCLFLAAFMILASTTATFSCCRSRISGFSLIVIELFLLGFLNQFQVLIIEFSYILHKCMLCLQLILSHIVCRTLVGFQTLRVLIIRIV